MALQDPLEIDGVKVFPQGKKMGERKECFKTRQTFNTYLHMKELIFFKDFICLFLEAREGREERERNVNVWFPLTPPLLGIWPSNPGMCPVWESNR